MRPIKFRAWDKKKKKMYLPYVNTTMTHGECIDEFTDDELMQFTGLLDRNGREIYEGDVVKGDENINNWTVEWDSAGYWNCMRVPEIEIIGNIYEHPELITKE